MKTIEKTSFGAIIMIVGNILFLSPIQTMYQIGYLVYLILGCKGRITSRAANKDCSEDYWRMIDKSPNNFSYFGFIRAYHGFMFKYYWDVILVGLIVVLGILAFFVL